MKFEREGYKLNTNRWLVILAGSIYDGSRRSVIVTALRISCLCLAIFQFIMKIIRKDDEDNLMVSLEALHWTILLTSLLVIMCSFLLRNSLYLQMESTVRAGFYHYSGNLTEEQFAVRAEANKEVKVTTKIFTVVVFAAHFACYFKAPLFMEKWSQSYPIWMPFEVNSWFRYVGSMLWCWIVIEPAATNATMSWVMYMTMAVHLIGQYQILILAIQNIDSIAGQEGTAKEKEERMLAWIKECVEHHMELIKFFMDFQTFYGITLLVAAVSLGMMLCTLGFIIISAENSMASKAPLFLLLMPEVLFAGSYCYLGQRIADASEKVGLTIFNTKWYALPLPVQRDVLMMLLGCKTRQLTAMGLHEFSKKGLTEILKTTFTYFNILMVLSRK